MIMCMQHVLKNTGMDTELMPVKLINANGFNVRNINARFPLNAGLSPSIRPESSDITDSFV